MQAHQSFGRHGRREAMDMPVRGHEGQMGQHSYLKEHTGISKLEEPGIMCWARGGVEREARILHEKYLGQGDGRPGLRPPQCLFSSLFFLMERVKLILK